MHNRDIEYEEWSEWVESMLDVTREPIPGEYRRWSIHQARAAYHWMQSRRPIDVAMPSGWETLVWRPPTIRTTFAVFLAENAIDVHEEVAR